MTRRVRLSVTARIAASQVHCSPPAMVSRVLTSAGETPFDRKAPPQAPTVPTFAPPGWRLEIAIRAESLIWKLIVLNSRSRGAIQGMSESAISTSSIVSGPS